MCRICSPTQQSLLIMSFLLPWERNPRPSLMSQRSDYSLQVESSVWKGAVLPEELSGVLLFSSAASHCSLLAAAVPTALTTLIPREEITSDRSVSFFFFFLLLSSKNETIRSSGGWTWACCWGRCIPRSKVLRECWLLCGWRLSPVLLLI